MSDILYQNRSNAKIFCVFSFRFEKRIRADGFGGASPAPPRQSSEAAKRPS